MKKMIMIIIFILMCIQGIFGYGQQSILYESGDSQMFIGYYALDTQQQLVQSNQFQTHSLTGGNSALGGSGGGQSLTTKSTKVSQLLDLKVTNKKYQSGDILYSTLFLQLPQQIFSSGGYFEYNLVSPNGVTYPIKTIRLDNNKEKQIYYDIPKDAINGQWKINGVLKSNGYKDLKVSDSFVVKNYSVYIYYLLSIIVVTMLGAIIYNRKKNPTY